MSYTPPSYPQIFTDSFTRANTALGGVGNGWVDYGNGWQIQSNILNSASSTGYGGQYLNRPHSEDCRDARMTLTLTYNSAVGNQYPFLILRGNGSNSHGYFVGFTNLATYAYTTAGIGSALGGYTAGPGSFVTGHSYTWDVAVTGANPTTITGQIYDNTAGNVVGTLNITDSTASLQGAGSFGVSGNGQQTGITNVTTYGVLANLVPFSNAAYNFSPGNWYSDSGRNGANYRATWNIGAYFDFTWNASATPTIQIPQFNGSSGVYVSYYLNGNLVDNIQIKDPLILGTGQGVVASASNKLTMYVRRSASITGQRWSPTAGVTAGNFGFGNFGINPITLDSGSTPGTSPRGAGWALIVGDSITEGVLTDGALADNFLHGWSFALGNALRAQGYEYAISACGYSGYLTTGDATGGNGDVPAYYNVVSGTYTESTSRWDKINSTTSLLDANGHISGYGATGQEPSLIYVANGVNDVTQGYSVSDLTASITGFINAARAAAPNAEIVVQLPFGLRYATVYTSSATYVPAFTNGVGNYLTAHASDTKVILSDFGSTVAATIETGANISPDNIHPTAAGDTYIAPFVIAAVTPFAPYIYVYTQPYGSPYAPYQGIFNVVSKGFTASMQYVDWLQTFNVEVINQAGFPAGTTWNTMMTESQFLTYLSKSKYLLIP